MVAPCSVISGSLSRSKARQRARGSTGSIVVGMDEVSPNKYTILVLCLLDVHPSEISTMHPPSLLYLHLVVPFVS
jgi:hypothetical protein